MRPESPEGICVGEVLELRFCVMLRYAFGKETTCFQTVDCYKAPKYVYQ